MKSTQTIKIIPHPIPGAVGDECDYRPTFDELVQQLNQKEQDGVHDFVAEYGDYTVRCTGADDHGQTMQIDTSWMTFYVVNGDTSESDDGKTVKDLRDRISYYSIEKYLEKKDPKLLEACKQYALSQVHVSSVDRVTRCYPVVNCQTRKETDHAWPYIYVTHKGKSKPSGLIMTHFERRDGEWFFDSQHDWPAD